MLGPEAWRSTSPSSSTKSSKSLVLSVASGMPCRMQQATIHMSLCGRGRPRSVGGCEPSPRSGDRLVAGQDAACGQPAVEAFACRRTPASDLLPVGQLADGHEAILGQCNNPNVAAWGAHRQLCRMADGFSQEWAQTVAQQLSERNVEFASGFTPDSIRRIGAAVPDEIAQFLRAGLPTGRWSGDSRSNHPRILGRQLCIRHHTRSVPASTARGLSTKWGDPDGRRGRARSADMR